VNAWGGTFYELEIKGTKKIVQILFRSVDVFVESQHISVALHPVNRKRWVIAPLFHRRLDSPEIHLFVMHRV
jgi:hypothetical protein